MHLTYGPDFKFYLLPSFSFTLDTSLIYKGMPYLCLDCLIVPCFSSHRGYLCLGLGSNACDCTCVLTCCLVNNSSMMVLHCGHTFLRTIDLYWTPLHALQYYTVGIPFWTWSQSSQFDGKLRDHVYVCVTERYTENIAYEENGWLSRGKFITLLTFEVSSFRENKVSSNSDLATLWARGHRSEGVFPSGTVVCYVFGTFVSKKGSPHCICLVS